MMAEESISCPFCGETIEVLIDCSEETQTYIEDCSVCCRPIQFAVHCEDGQVTGLTVGRDAV